MRQWFINVRFALSNDSETTLLQELFDAMEQILYALEKIHDELEEAPTLYDKKSVDEGKSALSKASPEQIKAMAKEAEAGFDLGMDTDEDFLDLPSDDDEPWSLEGEKERYDPAAMFKKLLEGPTLEEMVVDNLSPEQVGRLEVVLQKLEIQLGLLYYALNTTSFTQPQLPSVMPGTESVLLRLRSCQHAAWHILNDYHTSFASGLKQGGMGATLTRVSVTALAGLHLYESDARLLEITHKIISHAAGFLLPCLDQVRELSAILKEPRNE